MELKELREKLIEVSNDCLSVDFDSHGAIILSYAIRWLSFKIAGEPYEPL